ncbi:MAG: phosphotransferase [Pseudomonadales bacterium]|nr:phosphotransferase [Pseudomonadales bacterium]MDG1444105.1 phosphotransferase [Pseudomonadales bacterium]
MEPNVIAAFSDVLRDELFENFSINPASLIDLGGFESFIFEDPKQSRIIRITHKSHRDEVQLAAELEFLVYLAENGAPVSRPLPIVRRETSSAVLFSNHFVGQYQNFYMTQFDKADGSIVDEVDWTPLLFRNWGRCLGQVHSLAVAMPDPKYRRLHWGDDENLNFRGRIPANQTKILERADDCLMRLNELTETRQEFGLIHCDAHPGNFHVLNGKLTFFDFDDACYQWYVFDIATVLFSVVLQPWVENTQEARVRAADQFLSAFFEGYRQYRPVTDFMIEQLPLFISLRELSLYGVIHAHMNVDNIDDWFPKKFMHDRQLRIESCKPFMELDYSKYA